MQAVLHAGGTPHAGDCPLLLAAAEGPLGSPEQPRTGCQNGQTEEQNIDQQSDVEALQLSCVAMQVDKTQWQTDSPKLFVTWQCTQQDRSISLEMATGTLDRVKCISTFGFMHLKGSYDD